MASSNPKRPLRTYSRRAFKENIEPPSKKRRLEDPKDIETVVVSSEVVVEAKRKISDFFKPTSLSSSPTSTSSVFTRSIGEPEYSPPSSPPPESLPSQVFKKHTRRRLKLRPLLEMDLYSSEATERRKGMRLTVQKATIEGGLVKGVDEAILGPDPPTPKEKTLTRTQIARRNARHDRYFDSNLLPADITGEGPIIPMSDDLEVCKDYIDSLASDSSSSDLPDSPSSLNENPNAIDIPGAKQKQELATQRKPAQGAGRAMTQSHLELGQKQIVECKECGASYNKTNDEDNKYHNERHDAYERGLPIKNCHNNKSIKTKKLCPVIHPDGTEDYIVEVSRYSHESWQKVVLDVLGEVVDPELGCETYDESVLFMMFPDPSDETETNEAVYRNFDGLVNSPLSEFKTLVPRFRIFLFIKNTRVVSLLLLERITWGFPASLANEVDGKYAPQEKVDPNDLTRRRDGICMKPAALGVNKVWTHRNHRRQGLATKLLDCSRTEFLPGSRPLSKDLVAWTQTTGDGSALARRYASGTPYLNYHEPRNWFLY